MTGIKKSLWVFVSLFLIVCWQANIAFAEDRKPGMKNALTPHSVAPNRLLPAPVGISNKRAASLVKQRYNGARILGVSLLDESGPPVYRVRTLSNQGVVKSVFVDGRSGEVFE